MFNLNIVLGLLYVVLVGCELLVVKNLLRTRMRELRQVITRHEKKQLQQKDRQTTNTNRQLSPTVREMLHHFLNRHPFSRCCQRHFPHRSYELLVLCVIVAVTICNNATDRLAIAMPVAAVVDCLLVGLSVWIKFKCEERLQQRVSDQLKIRTETVFSLEDNMLPNEPTDMRLVRQLHLKLFEYEVGYIVLSAVSLMTLTIKFYQLGYAPIISLAQVQLTAVAICCQILLLRPLTLLMLGLLAGFILKKNEKEFAVKYPLLFTAVTTDYEEEYLHKNKRQLLAVVDTGQANHRINSELRIEDYRQDQRTEEHMNTHPCGVLEDVTQPQSDLHSRKPSDMGLIVSMVHPPSSAQEEEKYDEEERISPVKVNSENNSVKFNSITIKKQNGLRANQAENQQIRQIEEFQIAEQEEDLNYRTKKPQQQETAVCTSTETAPGHNMLVRKEMSSPLHEINVNNMDDRAPTRPLYADSKRKSDQILGSIIDCYDEQPTQNPYLAEGGKPKRKSRNKRIHIVYTQESSQYDNESRSYSVDTQSQHRSRQIVSRQEKQNVPEACSLANMKPALKRSINGSIHLPPIKQTDLMLIRNKHLDSQNVEPTEESCERKRKRRRTSKRNHQREEESREKSPYLQFLPKMLKKEETERNHSCVMDSRKHSDRKKRPQQCSSKQGLQLQIIKKTISSEIDTVYT